MSAQIVVGSGFGDEGKGVTTSYLVSQLLARGVSPDLISVVRFSGGHQAAHGVRIGDLQHTFSSFGSGTLQGVRTIWSRFCPIAPMALATEYRILRDKGVLPFLHLDPLCPVTTPYDIWYNWQVERKNGHGTVGVGFGTTVERHEARYRIYAQDIFHPKILRLRLEEIRRYYKDKLKIEFGMDPAAAEEEFLQECDFIAGSLGIILITGNPANWNHEFIFEGSQGIMLDQDYGFYPHVTWSNTTSQNALQLIREWNLDFSKVEVFYVTRCYQTRHGTGPMMGESHAISLVNTEHEINHDKGKQGKFRTAMLDDELLAYAIRADRQNHILQLNPKIPVNLVVTCLDQLQTPGIPVVYADGVRQLAPRQLGQALDIHRVVTSYSPDGTKMGLV